MCSREMAAGIPRLAAILFSCFGCLAVSAVRCRGHRLHGSQVRTRVMASSGHSDAHGTGMPAPNSVVGEDVLTPVRASGPAAAAAQGGQQSVYRILMTNQTDPYDRPVSATEAASFAPAGDDFAGHDRKAAKLSISNAATERFTDINDLVASLVEDAKMIHHRPRITTNEASGRTSEEDRNVRVRAFLYAASREGDNDFHLMLGRNPTSDPMYMTMEVSGLPPHSSDAFDRIKHARDAYKQFFGSKLPGPSYHFYRPPIPVEIEGSLFFDITHATGGHPGPPDLRPHIPTIWEVHPVTDIVFEP